MQQRQLPAGRKRALTPTPKWATPSPPHAKKTCRVANHHGDAASDAGGPQSTQNDGGVSASTGCSSITAGIGSLSCDQRRRWQMMRSTEAAHLTIHNPTGGASSDQLGSSHTMLAHVLASEQQKPASRLWDEDALYYYPPQIPMGATATHIDCPPPPWRRQESPKPTATGWPLTECFNKRHSKRCVGAHPTCKLVSSSASRTSLIPFGPKAFAMWNDDLIEEIHGPKGM